MDQEDKKAIGKTTVMFVAAEPKGVSPIRLGAEFRRIVQQVKRQDPSRRLRFYSLWATQLDDLIEAMHEEKPTVVHFSAHGTPEGGLVLEDLDESPKVVEAEDLGSLFGQYGKAVRVVILNSCYSKAIAEEIAKYVDVVIGMNDGIGIEAAIEFSTGFYRGLASRKSLQDCFDMGVTEPKVKGLEGSQIPTLHSRPGVRPWHVFVQSEAEDGSKSSRTAITAADVEIGGTFAEGMSTDSGRVAHSTHIDVGRDSIGHEATVHGDFNVDRKNEGTTPRTADERQGTSRRARGR